MKSELHYIIERNIATNRKAVMNYNLLKQQQQDTTPESQTAATTTSA
ncbi:MULTISPECIES: hypothetical protein [unclassified Agarivorans]